VDNFLGLWPLSGGSSFDLGLIDAGHASNGYQDNVDTLSFTQFDDSFTFDASLLNFNLDLATSDQTGTTFPSYSIPAVPALQAQPVEDLNLGFLDNTPPLSLPLPPTSNASSTSASTPYTSTRASVSPPKRPLDFPEDDQVVLKRQRNTLAARKYRQKRVDRISELESAVEQLKAEKDELRLKLAKSEAETAALREIMRMEGLSK
jgi:hypothetical protein